MAKLVTKIDEKAKNKSKNVNTASFWGLFVLVAIPLPGTGAWTGALVAALFDLPRKQSTVAIFIGVVVCAIVMTLASYGVIGAVSLF